MSQQVATKEERPFTILLIGTQMATGGAQKGLLDQARWFKSHGCEVSVAFFYDKEDLHEQWSQSVDFPIYNLQAYQYGVNFLLQLPYLARGLLQLWRLLMCRRFDVLETFTHDSNLLALPLAWLAGVPVRIATHRGEIENFPLWRKKLHNWLINVGMAQTLIAVSEQTRQKAITEGVKPEKVSVILSGIDSLDTVQVNRHNVRKELGLDTDDLFLLTVGRLMVQKGHKFLIQAMPRLIDRFPNVMVGICGDGPLRPSLENQVQMLGLSKRVNFLGMRDDVTSLLAAADIFILPSLWEGLPRALLEAIAAGLPAVATRVDGTQELITDGIHGLLVPPNDPEALADSIIQLLENPELRAKIGATAQAHVLQNYTTDGMCRKYYELILGFLDKG